MGIINLTETPADGMARRLVRARAGEALALLASELDVELSSG